MDCPVCHGDRNVDFANTRTLIMSYVRSSNHGPGGWQLFFWNGSQLNLHGECNTCDRDAIRAHAKANKMQL